MVVAAAGTILISDPFLRDPNFMRTTVLLCEHNDEGSLGFVLNRPFEQRLDELIPDLEGLTIPVFCGGPVQPDTLHFLHNIPALRADAQRISKDVYWGGNFNQVIDLIRSRTLDLSAIRFFLGYSGWSSGQLSTEMSSSSWLTVPATKSLVFHRKPNEQWKAAVKQLDEAYHQIVNYPIDPQLN